MNNPQAVLDPLAFHRCFLGDCRGLLPTIPDASVDSCITDPPYPEIDRDYGRWTEEEWHELMRDVVGQVRRVLKPTGSAVFILQPNSENLVRMRPWLWEFMAWTSREWNMVQDVYWWNTAAMPTKHVARDVGLLRPSVKLCVWLGPPDCYRNQSAVLWTESDRNRTERSAQRSGKESHPSGHRVNRDTIFTAADDRGGVTPYNMLPIPNTNSSSSAGATGHGAGTPDQLCRWWVRYITPKGGVVLDPFAGTGTVGRVATENGCSAISIERSPQYEAALRNSTAIGLRQVTMSL